MSRVLVAAKHLAKQSSYCAKVKVGAKKKGKGEGEGFPSFSSPSPVFFFFFALVPTFLEELVRKRLLRRLSETQLDSIAQEQTIICRQLFADQVVGSRKKKKNLLRMVKDYQGTCPIAGNNLCSTFHYAFLPTEDLNICLMK